MIPTLNKVLVTGATGFLGRKIANRLVADGYIVRALARKESNVAALKKLGAEIIVGDVRERSLVVSAVKDVEVVVHAAAGTRGTAMDSDAVTVQGTQNILDACRMCCVKKLVYISSCSVYGVADYRNGQLVTEESSLERFPERRGDYSASKQHAEQLVIEAMNSTTFPIVILRPGTIMGPGGELFTPMFGFNLLNKAFLVIGNGRFVLPFAYVDNVADAIIESIRNGNADNQIFNVVDQEHIQKKEYMKQVMRVLYPETPVVYFPYSLLYVIVWLQELLFKAIGRSPILTRYRLISSQRPIIYDGSKIRTMLGLRQRVSMAEALDKMVQSEKARH